VQQYPWRFGNEFKEVLNKVAVRHLFEFKMPDKTIKLDLEFLQRMQFQYTEP